MSVFQSESLLGSSLANCDNGYALIPSNSESRDAKVVQVLSLQLCVANILPPGLPKSGDTSILQDLYRGNLLFKI